MAKQTTRQEMEDIIHACKQEIGRNQEEIDLLRRTLKASEVLVASLEGRLKETKAQLDTTLQYWKEDREELGRVRADRNDLQGGVDLLTSNLGDILEERNALRDRLNRALGWIDHAQGKGPDVNVPEAGPDFAEVEG